MKQTNKLLNISNIMSYIFYFVMSMLYTFNIIGHFFERYLLVFVLIIFSLNGISNFIIGIINLIKKNKGIGIINILISIMFIFEIITYIELDNLDDLIIKISWASIIIAIVFSIVNLVKNKKNKDLQMQKYKITLFILGLLIEIIIVIIPCIFTIINLNQFKKALNEIKNDQNKRIVLSDNLFNGSRFLDEEGTEIDVNQYRLLPILDRQIELDSNHKISLIMAEEDNKVWIVNYSGKKIARIFTLFEDKDSFANKFLWFLNDNGYKLITSFERRYKENEENKYLLCLKEKINNIYKFGNMEENECQIIVKLNKNEMENDFDLYSKINYQYGYFISDEEMELFKDFYKYKKNYIIITKNGESNEIKCNNMIFTIDTEGKIAIRQYSNYYIPYYDKNSSGYFDTNGEKKSFKKGYLVETITENYAIINNLDSEKFFVSKFDDNKVVSLDGDQIRYCDNKFIITNEALYMLKENEIIRLNGRYLFNYEFINMNINKEKRNFITL